MNRAVRVPSTIVPPLMIRSATPLPNLLFVVILRIIRHHFLRKPKPFFIGTSFCAAEGRALAQRLRPGDVMDASERACREQRVSEDLGRNGLDALDEGIIEALRREPRALNRDMAEGLGVSEVTIANRIRSLAERKLVRVTAQEDIWALGYELVALVDVFVSGRAAEAAAVELAALEQTGSVSITMTSPELIVQVFARDRADLLHVLEAQIAGIEGVAAIESLVVLEALKYRSEYGELESL